MKKSNFLELTLVFTPIISLILFFKEKWFDKKVCGINGNAICYEEVFNYGKLFYLLLAIIPIIIVIILFKKGT